MIPFIRSLSELMVITESRDNLKQVSKKDEIKSSTVDSAQRKRYIRSLSQNKINLPCLAKTNRLKWMHHKEKVSKFFDTLDYNNQIQSSYDLTLLERQNNSHQQDIA